MILIVVQTIATVLMTYVQRLSLDCCNAVAKSVIDEYRFLKDSVGHVYASFYSGNNEAVDVTSFSVLYLWYDSW